MKFSIIIPIYNEEPNINFYLNNIQHLHQNVEIIAVDGGSQDRSYDLAKSLGIPVYKSKKGRGYQLNEGANKATGDILIFLHLDTILPKDCFFELNRFFDNQEVKVGKFRMAFDSNHLILKIYGFFTRFDSIFTSFGDQGIVVRKEFFNKMGCFPEWPLFEDVHFLRNARKRTKIHSFSGSVVTSARRFIEHGIIRQQFKNGLLIFKYLIGISPQKLYKGYYTNSNRR